MSQAPALTRRAFLQGRIVDPVLRISSSCLAQTDVSCMTCGESCPEEAISMQPRIGGPFLPVIDQAACTKCGACIVACPVAAIEITRRDALGELNA